MTAIAIVPVRNHYHINGLLLFWDTQYIYLDMCKDMTDVKLWLLYSNIETI